MSCTSRSSLRAVMAASRHSPASSAPVNMSHAPAKACSADKEPNFCVDVSLHAYHASYTVCLEQRDTSFTTKGPIHGSVIAVQCTTQPNLTPTCPIDWIIKLCNQFATVCIDRHVEAHAACLKCVTLQSYVSEPVSFPCCSPCPTTWSNHTDK